MRFTHETLPQRVVFAPADAAPAIGDEVARARRRTRHGHHRSLVGGTGRLPHRRAAGGPRPRRGRDARTRRGGRPGPRGRGEVLRRRPGVHRRRLRDRTGEGGRAHQRPADRRRTHDLRGLREDGLYDVQYGDERTAARGHLHTDAEGRYRFWAITPTPYPIPHDGPVGEMLQAVGRSPMRASHLHFMVSHPACRTLVTHIFVRGDELLGSDTVFGVKESLVKNFDQQPAGTATPDGRAVGGTWSRTRFDIVLAAARTIAVA